MRQKVPGVKLEPLRVPAGWLIQWNTLYELDSLDDPHGGLGGSSLFSAVNEQRRFWIDVEWRPEFDPAGAYHVRIEYAPWERTERGRRIPSPLHFRDAEVVHRFETRSREELVRELDTWLTRCSTWMKEGH